jgi:hypothetical protein
MAFIVTPGSAGTASNQARYSANGTAWSFVTLPTSSANWFIAGEINGLFVAIDLTTPSIATSPTGTTWTTRTLPAGVTNLSTARVGAVGFGILVVTSGATSIYTSDGINWSSSTLPNNSGGAVGFNGTRFVSTGFTLTSYSTDGVSWTAGGTMGVTAGGERIVWNGTVFCAINSGSMTVSTNGVTWVTRTASLSMWGIASNKLTGRLVYTYGNPSSNCYYSDDLGVTWTSATLPSSQLWRDVVYDDTLGLYCTFSYISADTATSPDGVTWTARTGVSDSNQNWKIYGSTFNGITNTLTASATSTTTPTFSNTILQGQIFTKTCAATSSATATATLVAPKTFSTSVSTNLRYSDDSGATWATVTMPYAYATRKYNGSYWLGLVVNGTSVGKSTDGHTYTNYGTIANKAWYILDWMPNVNLWVAASYDGSIYTSPNGVAWTSRTPSVASKTLFHSAYGAGLMVIGIRNANFVMTSPDGITWTSRTIPYTIGDVGDVIWTGQAFIMGAQTSQTHVARSVDGITWTQVTGVPAGAKWNMATNGTGTVVISNDSSPSATVSTDHGLTWANKTLPAAQRWGVTGVAYNGTKFVMGSYANANWAQSTDGITWTSLTGSSANYTGEMRSAWLVPIVAATTTYNQTCSTTSASTASRSTSVVVAPVTYNKTATATSTTTASKVQFINKRIIDTVTSTASKAFSLAITKLGYVMPLASRPFKVTKDFSVAVGSSSTAEAHKTSLQLIEYSTSTTRFRSDNDGVSWVTGLSSGISVQASAYGLGKWIAVGNAGVYAESTDGITWTTHTGPATFTRICFNGTGFVAISGIYVYYYVSEVAGWTLQYTSAIGSFSNVCYGNDITLCIGSNTNKTITSNDGLTWTQGANLPDTTFVNVSYQGLRYVAVGSSVATSDDLLTWTTRSTPFAITSADIAVDPSTYTAVIVNNSADGGVNKALRSTDGITWTPYNLNSGNGFYGSGGILWTGAVFITHNAGYATGYTSIDGITWTSRAFPSSSGTRLGSDFAPWISNAHNPVIYTVTGDAYSTSFAPSKLFGVSSTFRATPTSTGAVGKAATKSNIAGVSVGTGKVVKATSTTNAAASTQVAALLKSANTTNKATATSIATTLRSFVFHTYRSAVAGSVAIVGKAVSATRALAQPTTANTSKAALLNKSVVATHTSAVGKAVYVTKNVVANSASLMMRGLSTSLTAIASSIGAVGKAVSNTYSGTASSIGGAVKQVNKTSQAFVSSLGAIIADRVIQGLYITATAISATSATIGSYIYKGIDLTVTGVVSLTKQFSTTKDTAVTGIASASRLMYRTGLAVQVAVANMGKDIAKNLQILAVSSTGSIAKATKTAYDATVSAAGYLGKQVGISTQGTASNAVELTKQTNVIRKAVTTTSSRIGKFVSKSISYVSSSYAVFGKMYALMATATSVSIASFTRVGQIAEAMIRGFFLTIRKTSVIRKQVIATNHTNIRLPKVEHTIIRLD